MTYAKTSYLQHLGSAGWPKKHVDALAHFFIALEASSFRGRTHGEKILIIYQARVRCHCHWHDRLKQEGDGGFNIAIIDLGLLETISNEVWDVVHTENKREMQSIREAFMPSQIPSLGSGWSNKHYGMEPESSRQPRANRSPPHSPQHRSFPRRRRVYSPNHANSGQRKSSFRTGASA